uniref:Methyltransferase domain-containing protein n=1 Tax=Ditylum brightwellii TaxID=49249 RepID=A0A7S4VI78_9STRA
MTTTTTRSKKKRKKKSKDEENVPQMSNFLATQVWPSSRYASIQIEKYASTTATTSSSSSNNSGITICELGCGPGLPSLTAASTTTTYTTIQNVIATDVDPFALTLVQTAATYQKLQNVVTTRYFDLTNTRDNILPDAHLYIMSDVFESERVAKGAAWHTVQLLFINENEEEEEDTTTSKRKNANIWVFAQPDRAFRNVYVEEMKRLLNMKSEQKNDDNKIDSSCLDWCDTSWEERQQQQQMSSGAAATTTTTKSEQKNDDNKIDSSCLDWCDTSWEERQQQQQMSSGAAATTTLWSNRLWLCNVDETAVLYN